MGTNQLPAVAWLFFALAALLEVGGDAVVRKGLRSSQALYLCLGCLMLATYGIVVNLVKWDFSKLIGVYIAFFTVCGVLAGKFLFRETVPTTTWIGTGVIVLGGLVIQWGQR